MRLQVLAVAWVLGSTACQQLVVDGTPLKTAQRTDSPLKSQAESAFWSAFHGGNYDQLDAVMRQQTAAYLENPRDPDRALHLGLAHLWRISESDRDTVSGAAITDHLILSAKYLEEAAALAPDDARILGFVGNVKEAQGTVDQDSRVVIDGYFTVKNGVAQYPEFNLFVLALGGARSPAGTALFDEGLEALWSNLDVCFNQHISRTDPDVSSFMSLATIVGPKRACWDTPKAPRNFEGFFLFFGDYLLKAQDPSTAKKIYAQARFSPTYDSWGWKNELEDRIQNADALAAAFANPPDPTNPPSVGTAHTCMSCHQN